MLAALYYIGGRYYDPEIGQYVDSEAIENIFLNAEKLLGLDRHAVSYDNIHSVLQNLHNIFNEQGLSPCPKMLQLAKNLELFMYILRWVLAVVQIVVGALLMAFGGPLGMIGGGLMVAGGRISMMGLMTENSVYDGIGLGITGLDAMFMGLFVAVSSCTGVGIFIGLATFAIGAAAVAVASAMIQESLTGENWIIGMTGMSKKSFELLVMNITIAVTIALIVCSLYMKFGAKCFAAGTLVLCQGEDGKECHKKIEDVEVGDMVLAYDEETGEQGWKPVVQLFRNKASIKTQLTIKADDGTVDEITSTPGHKYYLPDNKRNRNANERLEHASYEGLSDKWVSACDLKKGDRVLLANADSLTGKPKFGIVIDVKTEECEEFTTYNFEVADFHTYYVGENGVLVHNYACEVQKVFKEFGVDSLMI